ncbi:MAG: hypothetical protein HS116_18410 [Planctomycetes bacterium]|nr:hypothetical protein [Planctomycetota bacterium]
MKIDEAQLRSMAEKLAEDYDGVVICVTGRHKGETYCSYRSAGNDLAAFGAAKRYVEEREAGMRELAKDNDDADDD